MGDLGLSVFRALNNIGYNEKQMLTCLVPLKKKTFE